MRTSNTIAKFRREIFGNVVQTNPMNDAEFVTITPEIAEKILQNNNLGNRPVNHKNLNKMKKDHARGIFIDNGETLCFTKEGNVSQGQHRLLMVKETGIPMTFRVVYNLPSSTMATLDQGKTRSLSDIISIGGRKESDYYKKVLPQKLYKPAAIAIKMLWQYKNGIMGSNGGKEGFSTASMEDFLKIAFENKKLTQSLLANTQSGLIGNSGTMAFVHYILSQKNKKKADEFMLSINDKQAPPNTAVRTLIKKLTDIQNKKYTLGKFESRKPYIIALCIKAFQYFLKGDNVSEKDLVWENPEYLYQKNLNSKARKKTRQECKAEAEPFPVL